MENFIRLAMRLLAIAFGYFIACLVAALAFVFLTGLIRPEDFGRLETGEMAFTLVVGTFGTAAIFGRLALLPAFLIFGIFEFAKRRDWLSHVLAGMFLGLGFGLISMANDNTGQVFGLAVAMVCTMLAGTAYWLVSGRYAGYWLPSERRKFLERRRQKEAQGSSK